MGGFKEGAQSHRRCRDCMTTVEDLISKFLESYFTLRTRENHEIQCQRLNGELKDYFSRSYGLNRRSSLNDSRYFHVIGGLPPDAMHDILEGVLQYCVKEILKVYIIEKKFFTLQELNKRISSFDYGYHNASNKPAKILRQKLLSNDHNLKQHANEMWCLALYLPFLICEFVPENDEYWDLFCLLLQIIRIVFSPTISKDQVPYLQVLMQQHHEKFKELFPDCPIIPKMHYMVHMPRTILRLGPLSRVWCMRYEAKHSYFKRLALNIRNFINLPYSLAKRHQESMCYYLQTPDGSNSTFLSKGNETGPGSSNLAGNLDYFTLLERSEKQNGNLVDNQTPVYEPKWVIIGGTKYKPGAILHIGFDEDDFPSFWKVHKICVVNKNLHEMKFIVLPLKTIGFHDRFQSYQVQLEASARENMKICHQKEFTCYIPTNLCTPYGNRAGGKFVCSRYEYGTNN